MKIIILAILGTVSLSVQAIEIPKNIEAITEITFQDDETSRHFNYDFEGIVKLSNCSGSLVQFPGQPDTAKAYVLTNGHCIQKPGGFLTPGEVWVNKPLKRVMQVFDNKMKLFKINATKIVYATMTGTDAALYELQETYQDIQKFGIEPFLLDARRPTSGMNIDIVSGYWDRGYRCHIDQFIPRLLEGDWTFTDSIRYSAVGCGTIGGTSGAPIIQSDTRVVVGINNTGNKDGGRCTLNNPCEVDRTGAITVMKRSYGQQTYQFIACLDVDYKIDLARTGCTLAK